MFSTSQNQTGQKIIFRNRNFSELAFPEEVKPLCNNKPAFEKAILFYGILRNIAGVIKK